MTEVRPGDRVTVNVEMFCGECFFCRHGGADVVFEAAGTEQTFEMAWRCARPNTVVTVIALYDTTPLITHIYPFRKIEEAYALFEQRQDGVIKAAVRP